MLSGVNDTRALHLLLLTFSLQLFCCKRIILEMKAFKFLLAGLLFAAPIVCEEYHCTKDKKCESGCCRLEPDGYALSKSRLHD